MSAPKSPDADAGGAVGQRPLRSSTTELSALSEAGAAAREAPTAETEPSGKLVYLMVVRTGLVTVFFALVVVLGLLSRQPLKLASPHAQGIFGLVSLAYLCSLIYALLYRRIRNKAAFFAVQVVIDVVLVNALVHLTGGVNSIYTFLFPLLIIEAALTGSRRGTVAAIMGVSLSFLVTTMLGYYGALPVFEGATALPWRASERDLYQHILLNVGAQLAIGVMLAILAEQLQRTTEQVFEQQDTIEQMALLSENIVQSLDSGLITVDTDGQVLNWNRAATRLLGTEPDGWDTSTLADHVTDLPELVTSDGPKRWRSQLRREGSAGVERVPLEILASPLTNRAGQRVGSVLLLEDLTEIQHLEGRIRRAERLAAVGRLAASIAHEIRNPLASVSGALELLQTAADASAEDQKLLSIAVREVERLDGLVAALLRYARPRPLQRRDIDLAELAREVGSACAQDPVFEPVTLDLPAADQPCALTADPDQLRQVLWNLLRNGAEAMPGGGRLSVRTDVIADDDGPAAVSLEVIDEGDGISEELLGQIFEPFFTTRDAGTGLGLPMVHRIVEDHGGNIAVDSRPGEGTRIHVWLPAQSTAEPAHGDAKTKSARAETRADLKSGAEGDRTPDL